MTIDVNNLKNEILELIDSHKEGVYWDFKEKWYEKNKRTSMLKDIICMSNNLENRNSYIIIGVSDDCNVVGVQNDENRFKSSDLIQYITSQKFANNEVPKISLNTITVNEKELDVIVIYPSRKTPFYIESIKQNSDIKQGYIYSRIEDKNTDSDKNAVFSRVQDLWRRRFGLDLKPIDRFPLLLKNKSKWRNSPLPENSEYDSIKYYEEDPAFSIKEKVMESYSQEYYMYLFWDNRPLAVNVDICYQNTTLSNYQVIMLDGCRAYVGAPKIKRISDELTNEYYRCYYYVKESIPFELTNFFKDDSNCCHKDALNNILNNIVIFNSEVEKDTIFACIKFNIDELKNEVSSNLNNKEILGKLISLKDDDPNADMYKKDYIVNKSIIALLDKYRKRSI